MIRDEKLIAETFTEYVQAFQTLNPQAVFSYCHLPCMFIAPQGVLVMASSAEVERFFGRIMDGLKARGYGRSELKDLQVKQMSKDTALVSVGRVHTRPMGRNWSGSAKPIRCAKPLTAGKLLWPWSTIRRPS